MKIICIGRNYKKHAEEMKSELPKTPVWFMKPQTSVINRNRPFYYPEFSKEIHHELEIVVRINKLGKHIDRKFAHTYYDEIGIGLDLTARDVQRKAKEKGLPWEAAKAFDGSAPIGKFVSKNKFKDINDINFRLLKNNELVQYGNTSDMIFNIDVLIEYISKYVTLKIGDLIFTGTPEGVGPVEIGDKLDAFIESEKLLSTNIK